MTGLYNRRYLEKTILAESQRAIRYKKPLSIIMLDTDDFKHYNDTNGHVMGDKLLIKISEIFRRDIRTSDFASRYGGEEFTILLPETSVKGAVDLAERIRKDVSRIKIQGKELQPGGRISISAGVSSYPELVSNPDDLIKHADKCLYKAKENGKNRVVFSDD
jgi:diguanylate cyclase (GGDEF)-like protein